MFAVDEDVLYVLAAPQRRVPVVLGRVVRATWQVLGDVRPLVSKLAVQLEQHPVFLEGPGVLADIVVEVVVPALAALLACPSRQVLGY